MALSWPQSYLVRIYAHLPVLACKPSIYAAQQLYVLTRSICFVTLMSVCRASMLTHDHPSTAVENGIVGWCVCQSIGCDYGKFGENQKNKDMCQLSCSFILFSMNELMAVAAPRRRLDSTDSPMWTRAEPGHEARPLHASFYPPSSLTANSSC